jgi:ABC-type nitrate/sulfonate/bicarbonate transport system permease component
MASKAVLAEAPRKRADGGRHGVVRRPRLRGLITASRLRRLGAVLGFFLAWWLASTLADNRLFPPPDAVIDRMIQDLIDGPLLEHAKVTLSRGLIGLGIAVVVGIGVGVAMARNRVVEAALGPLLAAFYPVPKLALYPVFILILGFGAWSKIVLVALECAYPIAYNTFAGVQGIPRRYYWAARNFDAGRWATLRMAMRAASPSVMASFRIAVPIMLVVITITELLGESVGLGFLIRDAGTQFLPEQAMSVILFLGIIGYVLDRLIVAATRRIVFWQRGVEL